MLTSRVQNCSWMLEKDAVVVGPSPPCPSTWRHSHDEWTQVFPIFTVLLLSCVIVNASGRWNGGDKASKLQQLQVKEENDNIMSASEPAMSLSFFQECFNSPYGTQYFADYAEPIPGTSTECLSSVAKECKIYLIGGKEFVFHVYVPDLHSRLCASWYGKARLCVMMNVRDLIFDWR